MSEEKSARELVDEIRRELREAGESRARALDDEQFATSVITDLVKQAKGILSVSEMAKLSGVSRDTIYAMLKEKES